MRQTWKWKGLLVGGVTLVGASLASPVPAADHKDAPATTADPASDINDVFSFLDGKNFVLAMTVGPFGGATKFSDATQYVFHTQSTDAVDPGKLVGATALTSSLDVICTFDATQKVSCWAGDEYATGDASDATKPVTSKSGKMKIYAGTRSDPFFFNLQGFKDTVSAVEGVASGLVLDGAKCPAVDATTSKALTDKLSETSSSAAPSKTTADDFAGATANVLGLVIQLDPTVVTKGGKFVSVWASTNKAK